METAIGINKAIVEIVASAIGWFGFLILIWVIRNLIVAAMSRAFVQVIESADDKTLEILLRYGVDKRATMRDIYEHLKSRYEKPANPSTD